MKNYFSNALLCSAGPLSLADIPGGSYMKNFGKIAVLGAVLSASCSFAFADSLGSYGTGSAMGNINTGLVYQGFVANNGDLTTFATNPYADITNGNVNTAVNIGAGAPWHDALPGSTWVSYVAGTNPASPGSPSVVAPQGYYTFTTTFSVGTAGSYYFNLNVLADDASAIFVNGANTPAVAAGPLGNDGACSQFGINCETVTNETFMADLGVGVNSLTFVVEQTGGNDLGLDFSGVVAPAPEPSSLMLLGTGLMGAAGMFFRRRAVA
jgi:hypothetical protein